MARAPDVAIDGLERLEPAHRRLVETADAAQAAMIARGDAVPASNARDPATCAQWRSVGKGTRALGFPDGTSFLPGETEAESRGARSDALREGKVVLKHGVYLAPDALIVRGGDALDTVFWIVPRASITGFAYRRTQRGAARTVILFRDESGDEISRATVPRDVREQLEAWRSKKPAA
ncbi:MAG: hypothetical protein HYV09_40145 [Deltaproteobacteria bacterium]|nr:hypothetical protein [Deltaproteobacteria bacterium]